MGNVAAFFTGTSDADVVMPGPVAAAMSGDSPVVTVLTAPGEPGPPGLEPLHEQAEVRFAADEADLRAALPDTDALMVTDFRTEALEAAWPSAGRLQWIHATSAGVDALLFPGIRDSEVAITNARGIFDRAIAEYVLGVILMFAKDFRRNVELQQAHEWRHRDTERILGKRVLVIGAGAIGREIGGLCRAAGLRADGVARRARDDDEVFETVHPVAELRTHLGAADFVVIAAPLTPATEGLIGADELAAMKPSARLINIGRGPILDTDALIEALEAGRIAGAGLDVFETEPLPADHPLWARSDVLISAHMAGDFLGWREALTEQFLENFERWRRGEPLHNVVDKNRGYVPPETSE